MEHESGSGLHTRSKAAPDWTVEESLILVNEVTAIEADCRDTLSSFQKWKIIVENCNALDVNRNLNQCRRKWNSLLTDYRNIIQSGSRKAGFNSELFKGIERYVKDFEDGYHTEPEPLPQNQTVEVKPKPTRRLKSENNEIEECSSEQQVDHHRNESKMFVEIDRVDDEENMAKKLRESAEMIEAIVNSNKGRHDLTRMNGDKIIICLSNLAVALDELCKLQTDSVV